MLELPDVPWVALDTETSGLHPDDGARVACVALAYVDESGKMWSRGLPFDQGVRDKLPNAQLEIGLFGETEDPNLPEEAWEELLDWLYLRATIYHNSKFDITMMRVGTRHWPGRDRIAEPWWCTMLTQGVLDPIEPRGLDVSAQRLGIGAKAGLTEVRGWLKSRKFPTSRYDLVPWDLISRYVVADAEMTASLYSLQTQRVVDDETVSRVEREFRLTNFLYGCELRGMRYDAERSLVAAEQLEAEADALEATMPFRVTEMEGKRYFFGECGLIPDRVSDKTGKPSLDEEQVRAFAKKGIPWAKEYAEVSKKRRAVSMYYRGYPEKIGLDGRLRCSYRQGSVKSGRMSVERVQLQALPKKDKNIQGVPGVRELILAEPGCGLWNIDVSQAELRIASRYSNCTRMLNMLAAGVDQHAETTKNVLHVQPDHPLWKEKRDIGKRMNFAGIFMIGAETFQANLSKLADIHLPIEECDQYIRRWRSLYPEFEYAYTSSKRQMERQGYVTLLRNTDYAIPSYLGPLDWAKTGWNRVVQGSLAEAFKMWLGWIEQEHPGYAILTIHDSVVLEAPVDEGDQIAADISAYGTELFTGLFNIEMPVDIDRWL